MQDRVVSGVEALGTFPERSRVRDRVPGTREFVVRRLPYAVFVKMVPQGVIVLNAVHPARKFPK